MRGDTWGLKGCEIIHIASFILVEIVFVLCLCESVDMLLVQGKGHLLTV